MADYFNAKEVLPLELITKVLEYIPKESRNGSVLYFSDDFYGRRNAEIARCFQIYQSDPQFGSFTEIYEVLSQEYGLTVRQISKIVKEVREHGDGPAQRRRNYTGIRVGRISRRMRVRPKY